MWQVPEDRALGHRGGRRCRTVDGRRAAGAGGTLGASGARKEARYQQEDCEAPLRSSTTMLWLLLGDKMEKAKLEARRPEKLLSYPSGR